MKEKAKAKARKPVKIWLFWTLKVLRFFLVPFLCAAAVITGLIIGYAVLGEQDGSEIWSLETWKHLFDLIFAPS